MAYQIIPDATVGVVRTRWNVAVIPMEGIGNQRSYRYGPEGNLSARTL